MDKLKIRRIEAGIFGFCTSVGVLAILKSTSLIDASLAFVATSLMGATTIKSLFKLHRKEID